MPVGSCMPLSPLVGIGYFLVHPTICYYAEVMLVCRYLLLCEYITESPEGRVTIQGVFNRINVLDFPVTQQPFAVVFELAALQTPVTDAELTIQIVPPSGDEAERIEIPAPRVNIEAGEAITTMLDLGGPVFAEPGDYRIRLLANDRPLAFRDLAVCQVSRPAEI